MSEQNQEPSNQPPGSVLAAVDFSDGSLAAAAWAAEYAGFKGARLILLHVVHEPAEKPGFYRAEIDDSSLTLQQAAEKMMRRFVARLSGISSLPELPGRIETAFLAGLPAGRIVEFVELTQPLVLVVGNHGVSGSHTMEPGGVAKQVIEMAAAPVLVHKP